MDFWREAMAIKFVIAGFRRLKRVGPVSGSMGTEWQRPCLRANATQNKESKQFKCLFRPKELSQRMYTLTKVRIKGYLNENVHDRSLVLRSLANDLGCSSPN
jgi:hypothetical protein